MLKNPTFTPMIKEIVQMITKTITYTAEFGVTMAAVLFIALGIAISNEMLFVH